MDYADIPSLAHQPITFDSPDNARMVSFQDRAIGVFYMHPEFRAYASQTQGRPIYEPVPYIKIIQPGEKDVLHRRVKPEDKIRFSKAWADFQANREQNTRGTPLATLFPHHPEVVATLNHIRVMTVEQLAELNDGQLQNIGLGAHQWREQARNLLASAEKGKGYQEVQSQLEAKEREIARLTDIVEKLSAKVDALDEGKPRRGRRRAVDKETE